MFREKKVNGIMARAKARWAAERENVQIISVIWKSDILMNK